MTNHKFEIGKVLRAGVPGRTDSVIPAGSYEIMRHLPSRDGERDPQYRIRATVDGHERIVRESDLQGGATAEAPSTPA